MPSDQRINVTSESSNDDQPSPNDARLQSILTWAIANSTTTDTSNNTESTRQPVEPKTFPKDLIDAVLGEDDPVRMRRCFTCFTDDSASLPDYCSQGLCSQGQGFFEAQTRGRVYKKLNIPVRMEVLVATKSL